MVCARRATRGTAQKRRDDGPHTPSAPLEGPAKVKSWQGEPATMRRSAPSGAPSSTRLRRPAPSVRTSHTSPASRRYGTSPVAAARCA
eukprot:6286990-Alexandrium_andersonii.AAC.1